VENIADLLDMEAARISMEAKAKELDEVLLSLGWTFPRRRRGTAEAPVDYLDGSCLVYAEERLLDTIDYRGPQSIHGEKVSSASGWSAGRGEGATIIHSGDVMSETGGKHALRVRLSRLPETATDCIFTLSAYHSRDLSKFVSPNMMIFDPECPDHVLSSYAVVDAGTASAVVVCSLTRIGGVWTVRAHTRTCDGTVRDYTPIEASIAAIQERYDRLRRRMPLAMLYSLWQDDRALPRGTPVREEDIVLPLFDLGPELFRSVMQFV